MSKTLIIGARGFVGSHLAQSFDDPTQLRLMVRDKHKSPFDHQYEVVEADLLKPDSLNNILENVSTIYYLAHAMDQNKDFEEIERKQAENLSQLLTSKQRLIYLSGMGEAPHSKHLRSRQSVGNILRSSQARIIELRASIVIGQGSASYEMIKAIVERFPVILDARWARSMCQPIALSNLISILKQAQTIAFDQNEIIEIGDFQKLAYVDLLKTYARVNQLNRPVIKIEDFPIKLVKEIMQIFLPEYYEVGHKLLDSITIETTIKNPSKWFEIEPISTEQAMEKIKQITPPSKINKSIIVHDNQVFNFFLKKLIHYYQYHPFNLLDLLKIEYAENHVHVSFKDIGFITKLISNIDFNYFKKKWF
jgi:uncharacterized protein YbjT (DUF2867 family)